MYGKEEITIEAMTPLTADSFAPEDIDVMKKDIAILLEENAKNPSLLELIEGLSWWVTILGLVLLSIPTVVAAVVLQLWILLAITAAVALLYMGFFLLIHNHFSKVSGIHEALEQKVTGLVDFLGTLLTALYTIKESLKTQVDAFFTENKRLEKTVDALSVQNALLTAQVQDLTKTAKAYKITQAALENTVNHLQESTAQHQDLVIQYEMELGRMKINHDEQLAHLQQEINALTLIRTDLNFQLEMVKSKAQALAQCHTALMAIDSKHRENLASFENRLNTLLDDQNATFTAQLCKINDTSQRFDTVLTDLQALNRQYEKIIAHEQAQLASIESLSPEFALADKENAPDSTNMRFFSRKSVLPPLQPEKNTFGHAAMCRASVIT